MNKIIYNKIAASVAVVFSLLSIIEGTKVLLGVAQTEYVVLTPLLIYNVVMGFMGVFVGIALWRNHARSLMFTSMVAAAHLIVLLVVGVLYVSGGVVAEHSLQAMGIRTVVWLTIAVVSRKVGKSIVQSSKKY